MEQTNSNKKQKSGSLDWLIKGVLTKLGDSFDRLTGRRWKPSSSLATSELIERIKLMLDSEVKDLGLEGKFVPHNIELKMQWDKFSTDSDETTGILENQLHIAAIDHINDKRYYTYAPMKIVIKPDYFTEGVKLLVSFDSLDEDQREVSLNVTVPDLKPGQLVPDEPAAKIEPNQEKFNLTFETRNKKREIELSFSPGNRKSVGRTKENDLILDDDSVSKVHSSFVLNSKGVLVLADMGSTNGTFINGERIAYGRAFPVKTGDQLRFGTVAVAINRISVPSLVPEPESGHGRLEETGQSLTDSDIADTGETNVDQEIRIEPPESTFRQSDEDESKAGLTEPGINFDFDDN